MNKYLFLLTFIISTVSSISQEDKQSRVKVFKTYPLQILLNGEYIFAFETGISKSTTFETAISYYSKDWIILVNGSENLFPYNLIPAAGFAGKLSLKFYKARNGPAKGFYHGALIIVKYIKLDDVKEINRGVYWRNRDVERKAIGVEYLIGTAFSLNHIFINLYCGAGYRLLEEHNFYHHVLENNTYSFNVDKGVEWSSFPTLHIGLGIGYIR
jgi:hypothetical protein